MATEPPALAALPDLADSRTRDDHAAQSGDDYVSPGLRLRMAVQRRWKVTLAAFLALSALGAIYVATIPVSYVSTGVISFQPRLDESNGRDLTSLLAARYPAVITSTSSVGRAATAAGVSTGQLSSGLTAAVEPSTLNMVFSVTLGSAQQAQAAAQSLYLSTLEYNADDPFLEALQVETPTPASEVAHVSTLLLLAAVVLLSGLVAVMAALVVDQLTKRD